MLKMTEKFLLITQEYGKKYYAKTTGYTHEIPVSRVVETLSVNRESTTGGPGGIPNSELLGQQPDTLRLEILWPYKDIPGILDSLATHRVEGTNIPANIFLVGSILLPVPETSVVMEAFGSDPWTVDVFSIRRNISRRGMVIGDLALIRCDEDQFPESE